MAFECILQGRVQGVGCRYYCAAVGRSLRIRGAATNLDDGSVQVMLDTDDPAEAQRYVSSLKENLFHHNFYGQIRSVSVNRSDESISGDYVW